VALLCSLVLWLPAAGLGWLLRRRLPRRDGRWPTVGAGIAVLSGAVFVALSMWLSMSSSLLNIPQQPDANYHLNQIKHMLVTGDISSLHAGGLLIRADSGFYPAAFHGLAVTSAQIVTEQPVVTANLLAIVAAAGIWICGCVLLARQTFGAHGASLVASGVAAASFSAMPFLIAGYGVLWPNLLGLCLVPGLLACLLPLVGLARHDMIGRPRAFAILIVSAPGLFFAHPNAVATFGLLGFVIVLTAALTWVALHLRRRPVVSLGVLAGVALLPLVWWLVLHVPRVAAVAHQNLGAPDETVGRAVTESVLNSERSGAPLWAASALILIGIVVSLTRLRDLWQVTSYVAACAVFVGVAAVQNEFTSSISGIWYNNAPRLAAIPPIIGFLLLARGLLTVSRGAAWLARKIGFHAFYGLSRTLTPLALTGVLLLVYAAATRAVYLPEHVDRLGVYYTPNEPNHTLLSRSEADDLIALSHSIPRHAVVVNDPWHGTSLLYAYTGRMPYFYNEKALATLDQVLIAEFVDRVAKDPSICPALERAGADYVITGGEDFWEYRHGGEFNGVERVPDADGFAQVAQAGAYTLWRITACDGT
jgi:hypothetical protein